ncbi:uncharacterized protein AMSG_07848 [Thecamonas trahens ATCC 50062]|uniref:AAA+ ATPase domain-containing protein n=1 Tax=Thecamonas trahens ATCC 50062 TaxID=461836 RepID=A0A0L0DK80_THETB|nr:hypothetical protein AMSG_07848 [Thecamonas trahens ATCC 50062]KNC51773.1 hypothetical protein AMSG_07848 [Thecamonas trahens ATCC 50062]|eukprot:XP_013755646.1 hypothetical protein AMSG_07848 [Thecamonas trahens ATCC 50062]
MLSRAGAWAARVALGSGKRAVSASTAAAAVARASARLAISSHLPLQSSAVFALASRGTALRGFSSSSLARNEPDAAKPESAKPESAKPESAKPESAKPEWKNLRPAGSEAGKGPVPPKGGATGPGTGAGAGAGAGVGRKAGRRTKPLPPPEPTPRWQMALAWTAAGGTAYYLYTRDTGPAPHEIDWVKFESEVLAVGEVASLRVVNGTQVEVFLRDDSELVANRDEYGPDRPVYTFSIGSIDVFERKMEGAQRSLGVRSEDFVPTAYVDRTSLGAEVVRFLPTLLLIGFFVFVYRRMTSSGGPASQLGSMFGMGKAKVRKITKETNIGVTFKDVAGLEEAKVEVAEYVEFFKDPERFTKLGAKMPKGVLLTGPPGTGKTLLAKAMAGEAGKPFLSISGSEFLEMFAGVGPSRVRDLFKQARTEAPCIVFIDEIDAIGRKRGSRKMGGNDERENTLNQLLVEMDGFASSTGVIVMAATNRADILDPALLRPGRFDRQVTVDAADLDGRRDIFKVHLKNIKIAPTGDNAAVSADELETIAAQLAKLTPGFSGADIANVCNEAALIAARTDKPGVDLGDFEAAIERTIGGLEKKSRVLSPKERRTVAYHEAGHAVAGWFLEHTHPLLKVSIVPRGSAALGYAQYLPKDQYLYTTEQLDDMMAMTLAGRTAEAEFFGRVTTGAQDDLRKVTRMAYENVVAYGFSPAVGNVSFPLPQDGDMVTDKPYSNTTAKLIDTEVNTAVSRAYARAEAVIRDHREDVERLAEALLEREVIRRDDIVEILGPRPFGDVADVVPGPSPLSPA